MSASRIAYRVASEPWELEQIHRLNRDTFAGEIPQHRAEGDRLVDKFHAENTYIVAVEGEKVLAMLAVRDRRPFSLDAKLPNLDDYLPPDRRVCELRLLAIEKDRRNGRLLPGLLRCLWEVGNGRGYEVAVMSAYAPRVEMYERLGCTPFGPQVGTPEVPFQPMLATRDAFAAALRRFERSPDPRPDPPSPAAPRNFLPGPVELAPEARRAFAGRPISHRSAAFHTALDGAKQRLRELTGAPRVEVMVGSGTLANDVVAAQLGLLPGRGVVLSNGEFGRRLEDHARRHRLRHEVVSAPWGEGFAPEAIAAALAGPEPPTWLWLTHCETATAVLNDLDGVRALCAARGVLLCADCISSLGTVPVDLSGVYLASGVSGKALRALPGLGLVFYDHEVAPHETLPRYLDLGLYAGNGGVPFTHSSNLVAALAAALDGACAEPPFTALCETGAWLRARLRAQGYALVAPEEIAAPAVVSIALPPHVESRQAGDRLAAMGFQLSYESGYLLERNWIQICTMGGARRDDLEALLGALGAAAPPRQS
jgi:aspartate aminotransferase-like enzyme